MAKPKLSSGTKVKKSSGACIVCGQTCSGLHYGVRSCPACKSFFRRSIRMAYEYECPREKSCDVAGEFRVACRACRLKKCFAVGMSESAMQNDRGRIKRTKKRQHGSVWLPSLVDPPANAIPDKTVANPSAPKASFLQMLSMSLDLPADEALFNNVVANHKAFLEFALDMHDRIVKSTGGISVVPKLEAPGSPPSLTSCDNSATEADPSKITLPSMPFEAALKQAEIYLTALSSSLNRISCFSNLAQDGKAALLRNFMPHLMLLSFMESSMSSDRHDCLTLMNGEAILSRNSTSSDSTNELLSEVMDELLTRFRELGVDTREFACLRLLAFWSPEAVSSSKAKKQMQRMQKIVLTVLRKYITEKSPDQAMNSMLRYANILMLLGHVETIGNRLRRNLRSAAEMQKIDVCPKGFLWDILCQRKTSVASQSMSEPAVPTDTMATEEIDEFVRQFIHEIELDSQRDELLVTKHHSSDAAGTSSFSNPLWRGNAKDNLREFLLRKQSL